MLRRYLASGFALVTSLWFAPIEANAETIKIGLLLCQTGSCAEWGNAAIKGAELAAEEINASGTLQGTKIEFIVEDSAEDNLPKTIAAYRSLRNRGIRIIVGPTWSAAGKAIAPIAKADPEVLMISPSIGIRDFNESSPNLFNLWPHDEYSARRLAHFAIEIGIKKIALFGAEQPWSEIQSQAFKEEYELQGGRVISQVAAIPEARDLRVEAARVVHSGAEAVIFTCFAEQMGVAAAQLDSLGFSGKKLAVLMYNDAISTAKGALEGAIYAAYEPPTEKFRNQYHARFGQEAGSSSDKAYDAVHLLAQAINHVGASDTARLRSALFEVHGFQGASGVVNFNEKRAVVRTPEIFQVKTGLMGLAFNKDQPLVSADARAQLK